MGLFDKKKNKDDYDSPVEQIDLSTPSASRAQAVPASPPVTPAPVTSPAPAPKVGPASPAATAAQVSAPGKENKKPREERTEEEMEYGINRAVELMRLLPKDNVELVVQVVKQTLESTNIRIKDIIEDGSHKQKRIEGRISVLRGEIDELESEIATRKDEIATLEADHEETTEVKERLVMAEKLSAKQAANASAKAPDKSAAQKSSGSSSDKNDKSQADKNQAKGTGGDKPRAGA